MGKEIVVLLGSPRKGGNSEQLADAFIRGATQMGHHATKIYTEDLDTGCVGCGGCYAAADRPCCRHADFNRVADTLLHADGVVLAAPLYWYGFPGKMKCFIDNMYCFYSSGKLTQGGRKKAALLSCGHAKDYLMFDAIQRSFEMVARVADWSIAGQIFVDGVLEAGDVRQTDGPKRAEALGCRFFD